jgi:hypothetical protein
VKKRLITPYGNQLLGLILCALDDAVSAMDQKATDAGLTMISTANGDMGLCFSLTGVKSEIGNIIDHYFHRNIGGN